MTTAKIKQEGNNQIIILPEEYHLEGDEVYLKKIGNAIILTSQENLWDSWWESLDLFDDDFLEQREQPKLQNRDNCFE